MIEGLPKQAFDKDMKSIKAISLEGISGTDKVRLKMCDGVNHWFEEQELDVDAGGHFNLSLEKPGAKSECDCQDKDNRTDVFEIFAK